MIERAQKVIEKYEELESELARPEIASDQVVFTRLNKSYSALEKGVITSRKYLEIRSELKEWEDVLREESDEEMLSAAKEEIPVLRKKVEELEAELQILLVPKDPTDFRNVILEIRAGTGGDESSLFVGDLLRMYRSYCEGRGWKVSSLSMTEGTVGGFKEIQLSVEGQEVYGIMKFESGVHRVQRVPATESQGRIHTSAATVAVLPEADEIDALELPDSDLRIDTFRASGAGGQHVNKTESAIRITHLPTGLVVSCQDQKSQHKNKARAMANLQARLLDLRISEKQAAESAERKSLVGTGDRSAKIRTYNFPQGRVTDHRINLTLYKLDSVLGGDLDELVDALRMEDAQEKLRGLESLE